MAPLTITYNRQQAVDFTKPWIDLGLIVMMAKEREQTDILAFLYPFDWIVWLSIGAAFIIISLLTTILRSTNFMISNGPWWYNEKYEI